MQGTALVAQTAASSQAAIPNGRPGSSRLLPWLAAMAKLPLCWFERASFRAKLRANLKDDPELLRDIGISLHEGRMEAVRLFWEPIILTRR